MSFVFAAFGPILAFQSVRTSSDYFLPLETAAVASGALALVAAMWFLIVEIVPVPFAGTRTRLYGPVVLLIPVGLVVIAVATTLVRVGEEGLYGLTPLGLALQVAATVVYVVAIIRAIHNRAQIATSIEVTMESSDTDDGEQALRRRMDAALARSSPSEYDRAAAVEGVRKLMELGDISSRQAESALRSLLG